MNKALAHQLEMWRLSLVTGIRNAWDRVIWISQKEHKR